MSTWCPYAGGFPCATSPMSSSEFETTYGVWANYASTTLQWPVSLILAQWSIESSWGTADICTTGCPTNNPGNAGCYGSYCSTVTCGLASYPGLCSGVIDGYVGFAQNNSDAPGITATYAQYVASAYQNGFTIPSKNGYGCLPGAGQHFTGLQAACAALGSSEWASSDYCYCGSEIGIACCSAGNYAGQTLYQRAVNDFGNQGIVAGASAPSECFNGC